MAPAVVLGSSAQNSRPAAVEAGPFAHLSSTRPLPAGGAVQPSALLLHCGDRAIMMDGGNALATGGNFCELRDWSEAEWQAARERIEAQNAQDRAQR